MIKLYKLDYVSRLNRDFKHVFTDVGYAHINPAHVVMLLHTETTAQMRRAESWEPPILCITKIIMADGTIYYSDEPAQEINKKLFGGN